MGGGQGVASVAVFNFFGSEHFVRSRERVAKVFNGRIVQLPACPEGNIIILAFCGPEMALNLDQLRDRASWLQTKHQLPADEWLAAIKSPANRWLLRA
jgi:hypothetical protein